MLCPYSCPNRTEFGYCKTTACIYAPTVTVSRKPTHADRIRAKTDEELALWLAIIGCPPLYVPAYQSGKDICTDGKGNSIPLKKACDECWLDWLRQEAEA